MLAAQAQDSARTGAPSPASSTITVQAGAVVDHDTVTVGDVVRLTVFTTDVDELLGAYGSAAELIAPNLPAMTLIGVSRLAYPEIKVEIEATAVR